MSRINLFEFTRSISNESVSEADVKEVSVTDATKDTTKTLKEDTDGVNPDKELDVKSTTDTKTTQPGPKDGGGDGTAQHVDAKKVGVGIGTDDVAENLKRDQNGGRHIDQLPKEVGAKDNLSASDISHSVESHGEEAELKTIETGSGDDIGTPDALIMDLDDQDVQVVGMTDAADDGISQADAAVAEADNVMKGVASVERYLGLLTRIEQTGATMTRELRSALSFGLEQIDAELFFQERVALEAFDPSARVSLEANDVVVGSSRPEVVDGEDAGAVASGVKSKLKKLIQAAVRMFWRVVNMVADALSGVLSSIPKMRDHLSDLKSRVKVLQGDTDFQLKGSHRLMVGDEFVGDSRAALQQVQKVGNELLVAWPSQLAKILEDWEKGRPGMFNFTGKNDAINHAKIVDGVSDLLDRAFRGLQSISPKDKEKVPSGLLNSTRVQWSGPLPGNRALYIGVNVDSEEKDFAYTSEAVKLNFSAIPGESTTSEATSVTSLSGGEAVVIIRELEKILDLVEDSKAGMAKIKELAKSAAASAESDEWAFYLGNQAKAMAGTMALGVAKSSSESQNVFYGYLLNMVKAYIGYITLSLKAEEGGSTIDGETA